MLITKKLIITAIVVSLIGLVLPIKTILAHSGTHDNKTSEQKTPKTKQEQTDSHTEINQNIDPKTDTSMSSEVDNFPVVEETKMDVANKKSTQSSLIPKKGEVIFALLVISPFSLKLMRQQIHKTN